MVGAQAAPRVSTAKAEAGCTPGRGCAVGQGRQRWLWAGRGFHPPPVPAGVPGRRGGERLQHPSALGPAWQGGDSGHGAAGPVGGGWRSSGGRARGAGEGPTGAGARAAPPPSLSLPPSPPVPSSFPSPPRSSRRRPVPSRGSAGSAPLRPVLPPPPHAGVPSGQQPPAPPAAPAWPGSPSKSTWMGSSPTSKVRPRLRDPFAGLRPPLGAVYRGEWMPPGGGYCGGCCCGWTSWG